MNLLLDSCVWGKAKPDIEKAGFFVEWVGDWVQDPGDTEILKIANKNDQVLVTLDKDFGELAVIKGHHHNGIIRLVEISAQLQANIVISICKKYSEDLKNKAIITVQGDRVRIRGIL